MVVVLYIDSCLRFVGAFDYGIISYIVVKLYASYTSYKGKQQQQHCGNVAYLCTLECSCLCVNGVFTFMITLPLTFS